MTAGCMPLVKTTLALCAPSPIADATTAPAMNRQVRLLAASGTGASLTATDPSPVQKEYELSLSELVFLLKLGDQALVEGEQTFGFLAKSVCRVLGDKVHHG